MRHASKYFTWRELQCRGSGLVRLPRTSQEEAAFWGLLEIAEQIRSQFGHPVVCRSGHRGHLHNLKIGGALRSMHLFLAMDLAPRRRDWPGENFDHAMSALSSIIEEQNLGGVGRDQNFIHIDLRESLGRPRARWEDNARWTRYDRYHPEGP